MRKKIKQFPSLKINVNKIDRNSIVTPKVISLLKTKGLGGRNEFC